MIADDTTDRFKILLGPEDYADHILDTAGADPAKELDEFRRMVSDEQRDEFEAMVAEKDPYEALLSLRWRVPGELMCGHSSASYATDIISLAEYAARKGGGELDFEGTAPEGLCSHCWSNIRKTLSQQVEREQEGVTDRIGTVGYRLRWKQKGRARKEWYDIVVRPETTMAELDRLVCRFTTLDDFHLRMYGLEDEYLDSSINVVPDHQHSNPSDTLASEITIGEVAERASLWEGDRLSLVYDFGTPSHYYCIVKEVYEPAELDSLLADTDLIAETETAAIIDQKRP
ncbi:MAG: hypothetical protein V5A55_13375 [Halovenus sp.]